MTAALITLLGLTVGSFLNVVIHRIPRGESVISPGSHCPRCGRPVRARHNIPVLGWLLLRGRCADCRAPIGIRYPLVELGTGVLFLVLALWFNHLDRLGALPAYLCLAAAGIALALIDLDCRRLPDAIVLPSYPVLAVLLTVAAAVEHDWWSLARAAIGGAGLFAFYLLLALAHPRGLQFGDVKLSGLLGAALAFVSWPALIIGTFGGFLLGALAGIAIIATGRGSGKTAIPFGPFMLTATLLAILAANPIANAYLDLIGA